MRLDLGRGVGSLVLEKMERGECLLRLRRLKFWIRVGICRLLFMLLMGRLGRSGDLGTRRRVKGNMLWREVLLLIRKLGRLFLLRESLRFGRNIRSCLREEERLQEMIKVSLSGIKI